MEEQTRVCVIPGGNESYNTPADYVKTELEARDCRFRVVDNINDADLILIIHLYPEDKVGDMKCPKHARVMHFFRRAGDEKYAEGSWGFANHQEIIHTVRSHVGVPA